MTVEAAKVLGDAISKAKDAEAQAAKVEELAKPIAGVPAEDVEKASDPVGTKEAVEKASTAAHRRIEEAKKTLKEQEAAMDKESGPVQAVRSTKTQLERKLQEAQKKCDQAVRGCRKTCGDLSKTKLKLAEDAIKDAAVKKGGSAEDYFTSLAGKGDTITEAKFSKYLDTLSELTLSADHKKLVLKELLCDGVMQKQRFLRIVTQFYKCTKDIGITPEFDIGAKTVRKMNVGELLEALEEPKKHEESGIIRIKGRALLDGKVGWVSLTGNAGTAFLETCKKPYLACFGDAVLYAGSASEGEEVRKLKPQEVLEVLEGPQPEKGGELIPSRPRPNLTARPAGSLFKTCL